MGPIAYLADLTLGSGVLGSTEEFGFLGVGSMPTILEIRGLGLYHSLYQSNSFIRHISRFEGECWQL